MVTAISGQALGKAIGKAKQVCDIQTDKAGLATLVSSIVIIRILLLSRRQEREREKKTNRGVRHRTHARAV